MPHFLNPVRSLVPVGISTATPAPHTNEEALLGDKNAVKTVSPSALVLLWPGTNAGWDTIGRIVRVIKFQLSFSLKGTTG